MKAHDITALLAAARCSVDNSDAEIHHLSTDSRTLTDADATLFFAIRTCSGDGSRYVEDLYGRGVRNFVVPADYGRSFADANMWYVDDVVAALQTLAAAHRDRFDIPVIGITGSNGKTVVKDWLVQLLGHDLRLCANPKSYNSQIGVPLSVWQLSADDRMAVFEAGISQFGEMVRLQRVIKPTIGILTNVGAAHDEGFKSRRQKIDEKLRLFTHCQHLVYCSDQTDVAEAIAANGELAGVQLFAWGTAADAAVRLLSHTLSAHGTQIVVRYLETQFEVDIPFTDSASLQDAMHCIALMLLLDYQPEDIAARCARLTQVAMRMEMIEATSGCLLINDSYSLDMASLVIALDALQHDHSHLRHTAILSDMEQTGVPADELYAHVAALLMQRGVARLIAIGPQMCAHRALFHDIDATFYESTDEFVARFDRSMFSSETILLKGARRFGFERVAKMLQRRSHETVMEVDIDALLHNLAFYRSRLKPQTRLMAMVKASSYGAGKVEVAAALQWSGVDYLTVAYADEGVELRRGGITLPIMVMNPEESAFEDIINYRLEPDIYSLRILDRFAACAAAMDAKVPIHIEFDTGMHRLGYSEADVERLAQRLNEVADTLVVRSIFSHLACSEDPLMDTFTRQQIDCLQRCSERLKALLPGGGADVICHILNSSGITRFPEAQMDMVRLGIGLYGISPEPDVQAQLREVSRLVTRISQIKDIPVGDSVGYNRAWVATRPTRLAILPIGYADGLNRHLGGHGHVMIAGRKAPIVGKVCMDMCFVDVTDVPCAEGDRAVFFGEGDLLDSNAAAAGTITYELLTSVSPRVKRVYVQE